MKSITSRLVGSHFHPPAQLILDNLPVGCPLLLDPEPDNAYDENAIKVILGTEYIPSTIADELPNYGWTVEDLMDQDEIHLGYIAKSGGKPADGLPGNIEVLELISGCPNFTAKLGFTPEGKPVVVVGEGDE